jgi:hypothetical protein
MTLNEKFDKATDGWIVAHACEQIADDYAIEFSNWVNKVSYRSFDGNWYLTQNEEDIKKNDRRTIRNI